MATRFQTLQLIAKCADHGQTVLRPPDRSTVVRVSLLMVGLEAGLIAEPQCHYRRPSIPQQAHFGVHHDLHFVRCNEQHVP